MRRIPNNIGRMMPWGPRRSNRLERHGGDLRDDEVRRCDEHDRRRHRRDVGPDAVLRCHSQRSDRKL
uniref:Uncharacterized protein n=1 Tax=Arundo donax TaxID=35708 RepID=A0A0A9H798_ARUDO